MSASQRKSASMAVICFVAVIAAGCAAPKNRLYSGDPLPSDKVAVVTAAPASLLWGTQAVLHQIDGQTIKRSDWDGSGCAELLPGSHVLSVGMFQTHHYGLFWTTKWSVRDRALNMEAEAGHLYEVEIHFSTKGGDDRWDPVVLDKGIAPVPPSKTARAQ